jgi:hypothetical protein
MGSDDGNESEVRKDELKICRGLFLVRIRHLTGETEENHNELFSMAGNAAGIKKSRSTAQMLPLH